MLIEPIDNRGYVAIDQHFGLAAYPHTPENTMYQVKDAMSYKVVSLRPEVTVDAAIHILLDHGVSGAPVIDEAGKLCGVISQFQLLEVLYDPQVKNCRVAELMCRALQGGLVRGCLG